MKKLKEEAIRLYDNPGNTKSFSEIYAGKEDLFEDNIDDLISPKMRSLFESVYGATHSKRLTEEVEAKSNPDHNFTGEEGKPSGDGICDGHNKAGMSGEDHCATQGQGRGDSNNAPLFNESLMKEIYEKAKLQEDFDDDYEFDPEWDDEGDEEFAVDASDDGELDLSDTDSLDDLDDEDFEEDYSFEDLDDGTFIEGSSDTMDYDDEDDFDLE